MDIRVLFAVLVLSTAAVVAVVVAVHFRVKRHLREERATAPAPKNDILGSVAGPQTPSADDEGPKHTSL